MKTRLRNGIQIFVTVQFLLSVVGIPLYQHLCSVSGIHAPLSSCSMHAEPMEADCCAGHDDADLPARESLSQNGPGSRHCCVDIEITPQVKDAFNTPSIRDHCSFQTIGTPAIPVIHLTCFEPSIMGPLVFCDSSPPPVADTRLLISSLLL